MASSRIQRCPLTLGAYSYSITFRKGSDNSNADALSKLPIPTTRNEPPKPTNVIHLMNASPVTSSRIRTWTDQDPTLSKVKTWILTGWPNTPPEDKEICPYYNRRSELSTEEGCSILWGARVVVPAKEKDRVISMLHQAHPGIS